MDESKVGERVICTSHNRIAVAQFSDAGAVYGDVSVSYTKGQTGDQEEGGELAMTGEGVQIGFGSDSPGGEVTTAAGSVLNHVCGSCRNTAVKRL